MRGGSIEGLLDRRDRAAAWVAVAAAALLAWRVRLARAPDEPIWDGWRYQQGAEALAAGRLLSWNHVGASLLAVPFLPAFGERAAWALSVAAGVAGVAAAYAFAARASGSRAGGVAAALLLALCPVHVYWSGTAQSGPLALLVALLVGVALQRGRGVLALALAALGVAVRPDFVLLLPFFVLLPRVDATVPREAARPLLLALPLFLLAGAFYFVAHGGRAGRVSWSAPEAVLPADWDARAHRKPDGTLGLGPAGPSWSLAYAPANLAFYADVLADWTVRDWSGWVLHLPGNTAITPLALLGAALSPRRWGLLLASVALPFLGAYAVYYGFNPEYVFPVLVPALAAASVAVARGADVLLSAEPLRRLYQKPLGG